MLIKSFEISNLISARCFFQYLQLAEFLERAEQMTIACSQHLCYFRKLFRKKTVIIRHLNIGTKAYFQWFQDNCRGIYICAVKFISKSKADTVHKDNVFLQISGIFSEWNADAGEICDSLYMKHGTVHIFHQFHISDNIMFLEKAVKQHFAIVSNGADFRFALGDQHQIGNIMLSPVDILPGIILKKHQVSQWQILKTIFI